MRSTVDMAAALLAHSTGQAQPVEATRRMRVRPDALMLAPVAMTGQHAAVHAFAAGRPGGQAEVLAVPDARERDDHDRLLLRLAGHVDEAWAAARTAETHPQLVVAAPTVLAFLETLAWSLVRRQGGPAGLVVLGERLLYFAERGTAPGQQATVVCTELLRQGWATGQGPVLDAHLGAFLEWVCPGTGGGGAGTVHERVGRSLALPGGLATLPDDDRTLLRLLSALGRARRASAPEHVVREREAAVLAVVARPAAHLWRLVSAAVAAAGARDIPDLPDDAHPNDVRSALDRLLEDEDRAFASWAAHLDADGHRLASKDGPVAAAARLASMEAADESLRAAAVLGDPFERERAVLDGRVLRLQVLDVRETRRDRNGPTGAITSRRTLVLTGTTAEPAARPEPGQTWFPAPGCRPRLTVDDVDAGDAGPTVVLSACRRGPWPAWEPGDEIDLVQDVPDWAAGLVARRAIYERARAGDPLELVGAPASTSTGEYR